jgi:2-dehydro-3-deoxygalactonokinase
MSDPGAILFGDWGSTRLRLWLVHSTECLKHVEMPGLVAAAMPPAQILENALMQIDGASKARQIILCGMAGARGGLNEVPYAACPGTAADWALNAVRSTFRDREVIVFPGIFCRDAAGKPDVMRGEETQVFGAMTLHPDFARGELIYVLPGTHSKWVKSSDGRIEHFATCMTGELFAGLEGSSLLDGAKLDEDGVGTEGEGFADGIVARGRGGALGSVIFTARSARLCDGRSLAWASGFVSGALIADEVAAHMPEAYEGDIVVIGSGALAERYAEVVKQLGGNAQILDGDACVLSGLEAGYAQLG